MGSVVLRKGDGRYPVQQHLIRQIEALNTDSEWIVTFEPLSSANRHRTVDQNSLQHKWHQEAAQQLREETAEGYRAYCKLHFGVPILRAEEPDFRAQYDEIIRPLPYEQKLALMKAPIDFPVTRLMSVKQKTAFLDEVCRHYMGLGVVLTMPETA